MSARKDKGLTDGQTAALLSIDKHGPAQATEVTLPPAMDGSRKVQLRDYPNLTQRTLTDLVGRGLVSLTAKAAGLNRRLITISLTDAGLDWVQEFRHGKAPACACGTPLPPPTHATSRPRTHCDACRDRLRIERENKRRRDVYAARKEAKSASQIKPGGGAS